MHTFFHESPLEIELVDDAPPDQPAAPPAEPEQGPARIPPGSQGGLYEKLLHLAAVDAVQVHLQYLDGSAGTNM